MALTAENVKQLNNMNVAAQNAELGTLLETLTGGASKQNMEYTPIVNATISKAGIVKQAKSQVDSTATDIDGLVKDFNALLAKLKSAGIMA